MKKKFNVTGLCFPKQHYMADISKKLEQTLRLIDDGEYFIINRPRQYGKTTTLYRLADILIKSGDYIVFNISFEGISDLNFQSETMFAPRFVKLLAKSVISDERRLDVIITYLQYRYLAELKIWRGEVAHQEGLAQLADYIDRLALNEGYLVIFDHAKIKSWKNEWLTVNDKRVFAIWV